MNGNLDGLRLKTTTVWLIAWTAVMAVDAGQCNSTTPNNLEQKEFRKIQLTAKFLDDLFQIERQHQIILSQGFFCHKAIMATLTLLVYEIALL